MIIQDDVIDKAAKIGGELFQNDLITISEMIVNDSLEHFKELAKKLELLMKAYRKKQEDGEAGPVTFLNFTYLYSSVLTESFDVLIYLSDGKQYEGANGVHTNWKPAFIREFYLESKGSYERALYNQVIGIKKSEVHELVVMYGGQYYRLLYTFLLHWVPQVMKLLEEQQLKTADDMKITYGGLYDDGYDVLYAKEESGEGVESE